MHEKKKQTIFSYTQRSCTFYERSPTWQKLSYTIGLLKITFLPLYLFVPLVSYANNNNDIFSVKKLISSQLLRKSLLFIKQFLKYCPSYSEQYQCAGKANNLLKGTKIKYLTAEKKIVLEASCLCSKCKITLYTWVTTGPWCDTWLTKLFTLFCNRAGYWKLYRFCWIPCETFRIQ